MLLKCIDISSHQGKIDWVKVKQAGCSQAMIRAGWSWFGVHPDDLMGGGQGEASGGMDVDKCFVENIQGALDAGIDTGVYIYSYDLTPAAAKAGIAKLVDAIRPYRLTLPVAFDLEPDAARAKELGHELTNTEACEIALAACQALEDAGYYAILYSTADWLTNKLTDPRLAKFDKWVADVRAGRDKPGYTGTYGMWQYSWKGKISGISTDVDLNHVYLDYPRLIQDSGLNHLSAEPDYKALYENLVARVKALATEL